MACVIAAVLISRKCEFAIVRERELSVLIIADIIKKVKYLNGHEMQVLLSISGLFGLARNGIYCEHGEIWSRVTKSARVITPCAD